MFRESIVNGREEMTPDPSPEALNQLLLRYRLAAAAADTYFEAGFTVALEDVVAGPPLADYRAMIRNRPCHVIVLLPAVEAVAACEAGRGRRLRRLDDRGTPRGVRRHYAPRRYLARHDQSHSGGDR